MRFFKKKSEPYKIKGYYAFAWNPEVESKDFTKAIDVFRKYNAEVIGLRYLKSDDRLKGSPSLEFVVRGTGDKLFLMETEFDERVAGYRVY